MTNREEVPKVNAGSMADIAFLLLIFFLVTTSIESDAGLDRMLPRVPDPNVLPPVVLKRNILSVLINAEGDLFVNDKLIDITELRALTATFLDNGGATFNDLRYCDYCKGDRNSELSDSPAEAIVSLTTNRKTQYKVYISVQNELVRAYNDLRNSEAQRLYRSAYTEMESIYFNPKTSKAVKKDLKIKIKTVQKLFPLNLFEAETNLK